jgi:hypothetical protein
MKRVFAIARAFWLAHASRVLANASSRSRTFHNAFLPEHVLHKERLFRRYAETSTRKVCAT